MKNTDYSAAALPEPAQKATLSPLRTVLFVSDEPGKEIRETSRQTVRDAFATARLLAKDGRRNVRVLAFNEPLRRWELLREFSPLGEMRDLFSYANP